MQMEMRVEGGRGGGGGEEGGETQVSVFFVVNF